MGKNTKVGRPTSFNQHTADEIARLLAEENLSLRQIVALDGMPSLRTLFDWQRTQPEFAQQFKQAMDARTHALVAEIVEIADDQSISAESRKVMIQARQWIASKLLPKQFSDKSNIEVVGHVSHDIAKIEYVFIDSKNSNSDNIIDHDDFETAEDLKLIA